MKIDELTIGEVRSLLSLLRDAAKPTQVPTAREARPAFLSLIEVGQCYLIRTVTMAYTGRVLEITDSEIRLGEAAWIADTGRYADALSKGTLGEVEPYPDQVIVSRAALVDAAVWDWPLPRDQR